MAWRTRLYERVKCKLPDMVIGRQDPLRPASWSPPPGYPYVAWEHSRYVERVLRRGTGDDSTSDGSIECAMPNVTGSGV